MSDTAITLYEFNQQAYDKLEPLTDDEIQEKQKEILDNFEMRHYTMLLCRERYDYTVFINKYTKVSKEHFVENLINILKRRSCNNILGFEQTDEGYYECWIRHADDDAPHMYLLFDCEDFIVGC